MIQLLRSHLRTLIWFVVGLTCAFLFATGFPLTQLSATATSPNRYTSIHVSPSVKAKPGTRYWSVGVSKDPTHLAPNFYGS